MQPWKPEEDRMINNNAKSQEVKQAKDSKVTVWFATRIWLEQNQSSGGARSKPAVDGAVNGKWEGYEHRQFFQESWQ